MQTFDVPLSLFVLLLFGGNPWFSMGGLESPLPTLSLHWNGGKRWRMSKWSWVPIW